MSMLQQVKAPARICLFGDHQDYLGLPIIACAIDRFIHFEIQEREDALLYFQFADLQSERSFNINQLAHFDPKSGDHIAWVLKTLFEKGWRPTKGCTFWVYGTIPINAGLSSSSALVVALIKAIHSFYGFPEDLSRLKTAQLAYESEVLKQTGPGGKMDQYTIALGGIIFLETDENSKVISLAKPNGSLVIGNSGQSKDTLGLLSHLRTDALESFGRVKKEYPSFDPFHTTLYDLPEYKNLLPAVLKPIFEAAIKNYHITKQALSVFQQDEPSIDQLGELMNQHHTLLRDNLKITTPLIDRMIGSANKAGALGSKIVGSGGGGCICALCEKDEVETVIQAIKNAGAKDAFEVGVMSYE